MRLPYLGAAVVRHVLPLLLSVSQLAAVAAAAAAASDPPTPSPLWIQPSGEWCVLSCPLDFDPLTLCVLLIALLGMASMELGPTSFFTLVLPPRWSI
jgi:hypothetical protein